VCVCVCVCARARARVCVLQKRQIRGKPHVIRVAGKADREPLTAFR
jgi:hypothetical protein